MDPTRNDTRATRLVQHCTYMIATGKWRPGGRLPSIRAIRQEWGLNQSAVQSAYGALVEAGLVESRDRSGYFVRGGGEIDHISRHRRTLSRIRHRISEMVREESDLSLLGTLRYLTSLEEIEQLQEPRVAFVECTRLQAESHAAEISERLQIPVVPLLLREMERRRRPLPHHVETVLTSSFHFQKVKSILHSQPVRLAPVPIEVSPELHGRIIDPKKPLVLLESEETMAADIARDSAAILGRKPDVQIVDDPGPVLALLLGGGRRKRNAPIVLLSPRLWGNLDETWRSHPNVLQVSFRIAATAWPRIAEECGLPF
ncbi:MAG: GntR family transcriptional regulator [Thermoanaerobaculia bacterium]